MAFLKFTLFLLVFRVWSPAFRRELWQAYQSSTTTPPLAHVDEAPKQHYEQNLRNLDQIGRRSRDERRTYEEPNEARYRPAEQSKHGFASTRPLLTELQPKLVSRKFFLKTWFAKTNR